MRRDPREAYRIPVAGHWLDLPLFIPSVSSLKVDLRPVFALELLAAAAPACILLSAYDISSAPQAEQEQLAALAASARSRGVVVLLDSGNYEAYWKDDREWTVEQFHTACGTSEFDLCFSFDSQVQYQQASEAANATIKAVLRDQPAIAGSVIPILHGNASILPEAARAVAEQLLPLMIAVPERELGCGVVERTATIRALRDALDELDSYTPLHILGTGNPLSMLVYVLAGADSFDGLEWCQAAVDHETYSLLPLHHWDLVAHQTGWSDLGLSYVHSVLLHNLQFYSSFARMLREVALGDDWHSCATLSHLPDAFVASAESILGEAASDA